MASVRAVITKGLVLTPKRTVCSVPEHHWDQPLPVSTEPEE